MHYAAYYVLPWCGGITFCGILRVLKSFLLLVVLV